MIQSAALPVVILARRANSQGSTSPSGAGGAASSALSLGAYVTVITNTSTKPMGGIMGHLDEIAPQGRINPGSEAQALLLWRSLDG
jgi:hypothetical protein